MTVTAKYKDGHSELCNAECIMWKDEYIDYCELFDIKTGAEKNYELIENWDEIYKEIYEKF